MALMDDTAPAPDENANIPFTVAVIFNGRSHEIGHARTRMNEIVEELERVAGQFSVTLESVSIDLGRMAVADAESNRD